VRWKRWLGIILVLAAAAGLIGYGFRPQPMLVEGAAVRRGPLRVTVEEEGRTRVTDRFVVSAPVAGFARRIGLEVGDAVAAGQVVAQLEPLRPVTLDPRSRAEAEARVEAARAAKRGAEERARAAESEASYWDGELKRVQAMVKAGDMARERLDKTVLEQQRADATRKSARAAIEQADSDLAAARAALQYSSAGRGNGAESAAIVPVTSPVAGRVLKVAHESEGVVNGGEPLIELGNARSLEVEVDVLSADAVKIRPGTRVLFERWGGDGVLEGRVRSVEPVAFTKVSALGVEEQRVNVIADFVSPKEMWQSLGHKYRVEASFVLWEADSVLQAPASALFRYQDGWAVFVIEAGVARRRAVKVGHKNGLAAEILEGLKEGEQVITHPDSSIEEGKKVAPRGIL
jgi:HlyD family secretion protein